MRYGKIIDGALVYVGNRIVLDGRIIDNPKPQMLKEAGYLPVVSILPDAYDPEVFELIKNEPILSDDGKSIMLTYSLKYIEPVDEVVTMSKLKIIRLLKSMDKLNMFLEFLNAYPDIKLEWDAAVTLDSNDEGIVMITPQLMAILDVDDVQLKHIFKSCESELGR